MNQMYLLMFLFGLIIVIAIMLYYNLNLFPKVMNLTEKLEKENLIN